MTTAATPTQAAGTPPIVVTDYDLARLEAAIANHESPAAEHLELELTRANVVSPQDVEPDVVTMNSDVIYQDIATGRERQVRLVFPKDANADAGCVSVLAPLGSALLGLSAGQEIEWQMPAGPRRVRVLSVPYQPEANGDYTR